MRQQELTLLLLTLALHRNYVLGYLFTFVLVFKVCTTDLPNCWGCSLAPAPLRVHPKRGFPLKQFFPIN